MKKHSDNNVKDIYSFGAVIYVAERTLLVGIQRYFENEPYQQAESLERSFEYERFTDD